MQCGRSGDRRVAGRQAPAGGTGTDEGWLGATKPAG